MRVCAGILVLLLAFVCAPVSARWFHGSTLGTIVISAVTPGTPGATGITITWTNTPNANARVCYGTTTAYGACTTRDVSPVGSDTATLSGLVSNTLYHYRVDATLTGWTPGYSADGTFTTAAAVACNGFTFNPSGADNGCAGAPTSDAYLQAQGYQYLNATAFTDGTIYSRPIGVGQNPVINSNNPHVYSGCANSAGCIKWPVPGVDYPVGVAPVGTQNNGTITYAFCNGLSGTIPCSHDASGNATPFIDAFAYFSTNWVANGDTASTGCAPTSSYSGTTFIVTCVTTAGPQTLNLVGFDWSPYRSIDAGVTWHPTCVGLKLNDAAVVSTATAMVINFTNNRMIWSKDYTVNLSCRTIGDAATNALNFSYNLTDNWTANFNFNRIDQGADQASALSNLTATGTSGGGVSNIILVSSTHGVGTMNDGGVQVGSTVFGNANIPAGDTVASISPGTSITLASPTTGNVTGTITLASDKSYPGIFSPVRFGNNSYAGTAPVINNSTVVAQYNWISNTEVQSLQISYACGGQDVDYNIFHNSSWRTQNNHANIVFNNPPSLSGNQMACAGYTTGTTYGVMNHSTVINNLYFNDYGMWTNSSWIYVFNPLTTFNMLLDIPTGTYAMNTLINNGAAATAGIPEYFKYEGFLEEINGTQAAGYTSVSYNDIYQLGDYVLPSSGPNPCTTPPTYTAYGVDGVNGTYGKTGATLTLIKSLDAGHCGTSAPTAGTFKLIAVWTASGFTGDTGYVACVNSNACNVSSDYITFENGSGSGIGVLADVDYAFVNYENLSVEYNAMDQTALENLGLMYPQNVAGNSQGSYLSCAKPAPSPVPPFSGNAPYFALGNGPANNNLNTSADPANITGNFYLNSSGAALNANVQTLSSQYYFYPGNGC